MAWFQKTSGLGRSVQITATCAADCTVIAIRHSAVVLKVVGIVTTFARLFTTSRGRVRALTAVIPAVGFITSGTIGGLIFFSCATPLQENLETRQVYVDSHDLSETVREAILAGRVVPGMTREDVYATWGHPSQTDTSESLGLKGQYGKEVWIYGSFLSLTPEAEVFFRNGVVYSVSPEYLSEVPLD